MSSAAVVVCAHSAERWESLRAAVRSVLDQSPAPDEVVVVVDHNDHLLHRARAELAGVTVVPSAQPPGLSGARNTGVAQTSAPIVAFIDDDARARPGWLPALLAPFRDPAVIGAGGLAAPVWEAERPAWFPEEFLWVVGCSYSGLPAPGSAIRNPIGANMAFRRSALKAAGGFDVGIGRVGNLPVGCEETELAIRATRASGGGSIVHTPEAAVEHLVPARRTTWRYFAHRCWSEGRSKAIVTARVGSDDALASERSYATRTLPAAVLRELRGGREGAATAGAILAGFATTVAGYAYARALSGSGRAA